MNYFFEDRLDNLNGRSIFANRIIKLLYEKHQGDLDKAIKDAEPIFEDLEEYVRNIYELVDNEIPLYAYYQLLKYGADGYTEEEYQENIQNTVDACRHYYENLF